MNVSGTAGSIRGIALTLFNERGRRKDDNCPVGLDDVAEPILRLGMQPVKHGRRQYQTGFRPETSGLPVFSLMNAAPVAPSTTGCKREEEAWQPGRGGYAPSSIASSSTIIPSIMPSPICQKPGSLASSPNGLSNSP